MEMLHPEWSYQAVLYEMNVRQLTAEGTLRAAAAKLGFLRDMGIDAVWLMPVYPIGVEGRKGSPRLLLFGPRLIVRSIPVWARWRISTPRRRAHRLGMKVLLDWIANHTARDARWVTEKPARGTSATLRERPPCLGTGPTRPNSTMPNAKCGARRATPWNSGSANTAWTVPLRHGDAGSDRILERDGATPAAGEARSVHAGRSRGDLPFRRGSLRRLLCVGDAPPDERRGAAKGPRHVAARLHLCRPPALSPFRPCGWPSPPTTTRIRGTARSSPAWAPPARSWPSSPRRAARPAADLHRSGDRLRPFVRLLRPRPASRLRIQSLFGVLPPSDGVAARQSGARIGERAAR